MAKALTVGALRTYLETVPPETEITFGSSKYRMRPLIYYRFKQRGDDLLQIELNELDKDCVPTSEIDMRENAGYFLKMLEGWSDHCEVAFGSSADAVSLEFRNISTVVAINLEQTEEPQWVVVDD